ncbi:hypothetical protein T439DRAFT_320007 [Meredithblackwellia eburnea MCA 4105]
MTENKGRVHRVHHVRLSDEVGNAGGSEGDQSKRRVRVPYDGIGVKLAQMKDCHLYPW